MITFTKPIELDGVQLCKELNAVGIQVSNKTSPYIDGNGIFWLDIDAEDTEKAQEVLNAHIPKPLTIADKLESVGLGIDDLKAALGLQHNPLR